MALEVQWEVEDNGDHLDCMVKKGQMVNLDCLDKYIIFSKRYQNDNIDIFSQEKKECTENVVHQVPLDRKGKLDRQVYSSNIKTFFINPFLNFQAEKEGKGFLVKEDRLVYLENLDPKVFKEFQDLQVLRAQLGCKVSI